MITVVSHDAGGAELISSWIKYKKNSKKILFSLKGPALKIFKQKLNIKNTSLKSNIKLSNKIICGSSWASDFELKAIKIAKKFNKKVICYLDHWVNYRDRFLIKNYNILPDEFWTHDQYSFNLAKKIFKDKKIILKGNYYFREINKKLNKYKNIEKRYILYTSTINRKTYKNQNILKKKVYYI